MQPIQLFELASKQADWLSVRQSVIAGNVANASTPGYSPKDIQSFASVLETEQSRLKVTSAARLEASSRSALPDEGYDIVKTGEKVDFAKEMINSGEVRRDFDLNVGLLKSFHRMMLLTVRK